MLDRELQVVVRGLLTNAQCVELQCKLIGLTKLAGLTWKERLGNGSNVLLGNVIS